MELLAKKYWWVVRLAFIACFAWLSAKTVNVFVGSKVEPPLVLDVKPQPRSGPALTTIASAIDVNRLGKLFGIEPPPPPPPPDAATENSPQSVAAESRICWTCEPVKSALRMQLLFSLVASNPRYSVAHIKDLDQNRVGTYAEGERLCQWVLDDKSNAPERCDPKKQVVLQILDSDVELGSDGKWTEKKPRRVVILNEETNRLEFLDGVPGSGAVAVNTNGLPGLGTTESVPPPGSDAPPTPANGFVQPGEIVMKGENEGIVKKDAVNKWLGDLNSIAVQARIVPSFKNGVANGFKLFSIRPDSLYSALGVQNGDVITSINGFEMNSPDKALEIYGRLKDAGNIKLKLERRGQSIEKNFTME